MLGYVEDVREPLARYAVFVCPILSGSGVRVKLLEAFAAGIPVVSTRVGAEGLAREDGEFCGLADDPAGFAERVLALFENPGRGRRHGRARARRSGSATGTWPAITARAGGELPRLRCAQEATAARLLLLQIALEAIYNVGGGAIQLPWSWNPWAARISTTAPAATWHPPGKRCRARARNSIAGRD